MDADRIPTIPDLSLVLETVRRERGVYRERMALPRGTKGTLERAGWRKIKTLTTEETADVRARMGLDENVLRRSRKQDKVAEHLEDLLEEIE